MEQQGETRMCGLTGQGENRIEEEGTARGRVQAEEGTFDTDPVNWTTGGDRKDEAGGKQGWVDSPHSSVLGLGYLILCAVVATAHKPQVHPNFIPSGFPSLAGVETGCPCLPLGSPNSCGGPRRLRPYLPHLSLPPHPTLTPAQFLELSCSLTQSRWNFP